MGFIFNKLENALKLFTIFCFFILFCLPNIFVAFLCFVYFGDHDDPTRELSKSLETFIKVLEVVFSVISPFYAFFNAYIFTANNFESVKGLFK